MNYFFLKSAEVKDTPEIKETLLTLAFCPDQIWEKSTKFDCFS